MKYIFDEIVETKDIYLVIDENAPDEETRQYLITVVKDVIHHKVVDMVLDELDEEKKVFFIDQLEDENQYRSILSSLSTWILDFEAKVISKVKQTEKELLRVFASNSS